VIDSHCHLADATYAADLDAVVARAREAGVHAALVILAAGDAAEAAQADRVSTLWPDARFAVGVHPHAAHEFQQTPALAAAVVSRQLDAMPLVRAIGEIGLDYHYDFSPRETQQEVFRAQVRLARTRGLPVVVHTREADEDTIAILGDEGGGEVTGVLHCFTGTPALARAGLDLGFYISLAGIITFPKAGDLRETVKTVPLDRLLTETDSPFLAPVPFRGKRNEPAHVAHVVTALANLLGRPADEVRTRTAANFRSLFRP
jgi:TatD DNase family protein